MNADISHNFAKKFLEQSGRPLADFGSAEYGLTRSDAIRFIDFVRHNNLNVVGVEIWRRMGSRYKMDSLMTWYAIEANVTSNLDEVDNFVKKISLAESDLLTIQFSAI